MQLDRSVCFNPHRIFFYTFPRLFSLSPFASHRFPVWLFQLTFGISSDALFSIIFYESVSRSTVGRSKFIWVFLPSIYSLEIIEIIFNFSLFFFFYWWKLLYVMHEKSFIFYSYDIRLLLQL